MAIYSAYGGDVASVLGENHCRRDAIQDANYQILDHSLTYSHIQGFFLGPSAGTVHWKFLKPKEVYKKQVSSIWLSAPGHAFQGNVCVWFSWKQTKRLMVLFHWSVWRFNFEKDRCHWHFLELVDRSAPRIRSVYDIVAIEFDSILLAQETWHFFGWPSYKIDQDSKTVRRSEQVWKSEEFFEQIRASLLNSGMLCIHHVKDCALQLKELSSLLRSGVGFWRVSVVKSACRTMSDHQRCWSNPLISLNIYCTLVVFVEHVWTSWGANRRCTFTLNNYENEIKISEDHQTYEMIWNDIRSSNVT